MTSSRRFRSGAGRSEATTAFILRRGARLSGWPVVLLVFGSAAALGSERFRRAQARWRRSRSSGADVRPVDEPLSRAARRRRRALRAVDVSSRRARGASSTRDPSERLRAHCPERGAEPKTRRTTGQPVSRAPRRRMNAVVASLLPAPLRKRRDGAIPRLLRRLVLTPGLASLATGADRPKGRRPHALARRTVRPPARHGTRHVARRASGWRAERRAMSDNGRPLGRRVGSPLRASGSATPLVQLASGDGCGPRPLGRRRARRERSEPRRQHEPP